MAPRKRVFEGGTFPRTAAETEGFSFRRGGIRRISVEGIKATGGTASGTRITAADEPLAAKAPKPFSRSSEEGTERSFFAAPFP